MLNILWPFFIIISYIYALLTGNIENVNNAIFESTSNAVQLSLSLLGTICLWCGIMEIVQKTKLINILTKLLQPMVDLLFPMEKNDRKIKKEISLNMIANILGLGNAATPIGLKAMQTLRNKNEKKDELSESMAMLIVLNTASIQLIPTTVIAIRLSLLSKNPTKIILPVWIATICAAMAGILSAKFFSRLHKEKNK